jgi:uncharacterized protein (DUF1697 family)
MASTRYVALLRAVNLMTQSWRMGDLKQTVESTGYKNVTTYIQTGNVIFDGPKQNQNKLAKKLERRFRSALKFNQPVFVLTSAELKRAAAANPFSPKRLDAKQRCHLVFLDKAPPADRNRALKAKEGKEYRFAVKGRVLYYAYDRKFDATRRRTIDFEKILRVRGTARTWKVVDKLIELAGS